MSIARFAAPTARVAASTAVFAASIACCPTVGPPGTLSPADFFAFWAADTASFACVCAVCISFFASSSNFGVLLRM